MSQESGVIFKICTKNKGKFWMEFYKYEKGHKGNREDISVIRMLMD
jgi:hypothetical protein